MGALAASKLRIGAATLALISALCATLIDSPRALGAPPANDDFADSTAIRGPLPLTVRGNNAGSTPEPGEYESTFLDDVSGSVWYSWTAPTTRDVVIEDCEVPGPGDIFVHVYTGSSMANLRRVNLGYSQEYFRHCPLPEQGGHELLRAQAGKTYHFQVRHDGGGGREFAFVLNDKDVYDASLAQTVSRRIVNPGDVVRFNLTVRNRGNVPVPPSGNESTILEILVAAPGAPLTPGNAKMLSARPSRGRCSVGRVGIQTRGAYCRLPKIAPGGRITITTRVRADNPFDSFARLKLEDGLRRNNNRTTPVRIRR